MRGGIAREMNFKNVEGEIAREICDVAGGEVEEQEFAKGIIAIFANVVLGNCKIFRFVRGGSARKFAKSVLQQNGAGILAPLDEAESFGKVRGSAGVVTGGGREIRGIIIFDAASLVREIVGIIGGRVG